MKIAYLILAHKNLNQVVLLVNLLTIGGADNICFVHIDLDVFDEFNLIAFNELKNIPNCKIIKNPKRILWGGFSMIAATLILINEALAFTEVQFDYFSLHSGEDMPLQGNKFINNYLTANNGKQFIEHFEVSAKSHWEGNGGLDRLEYYWFVDQLGVSEARTLVNNQKLKPIKKCLPFKVKQLYGGSQWWTITSDCAKYVVNILKDRLDTYNYFKFSFVPDETLFQTIILNSSFASKVNNNNLRLIDWYTGPTYPRVFSYQDKSLLENSDCLFARKFNINYDYKIIEAINFKTVSQ